ncbi:MAG: nickel pincer cofactor biosynthesis protein LarC [Planctomycetia bacterium]|nr:nickel pincer cofactor biosynthesis protein LarC [Planctomycetia bacterium]
MKIAYLDCASGISGDMTLGALVDAGVDLAAINDGVQSLGLPGVSITRSEVQKHGFRATQVIVEHQPEHAHRHLHHIVDMIDAGKLSERQKDLAKRIFTKLGEAEAKVHGSTLRKVHFHEVGAVDSIADIVGAAIGWDLLGVDRIVCSPIPTGQGRIQIAHGLCSIPAPATAELLRGVPLLDSNVQSELTTPTGAAIVATLVDEFGGLPAMIVEAIGYGAGQRELAEQPNVLRLFVGTREGEFSADLVWVVETNLDDVPGEVIGHTITKLWEAGALDVYTTAIQMKKNRPGVILSVICAAPLIPKVEKILFRETSTLGVRRWPVSRHKLDRAAHTVTTDWGPIEGKLGLITGQPPSFSPEFESCRRVADEKNVPLKEVYEAARQAFASEESKQ